MMAPFLRASAVSIAVLLAWTAAAAAQSSAGQPGDVRTWRGKESPSPPRRNGGAKPAASRDNNPSRPIVFYLAKGEPDACGPSCSEWIAADGVIDAGSGQRFRALLDRLGGRRLPVFFHSPGGSVVDAIEIGQIMRQRRMTASVGWTIPQGCDPERPAQAACNAAKRSGRELAARIDPTRTQCNSACVYAFVGAAERQVPAGVRLGVHSSRIVLRLRTALPPGIDRGLLRRIAEEKLQSGNARLARYIEAMGIDKELLDTAWRVPFDHVRLLTRDELARFAIDTRAVVESEWTMDDRPSVPPAVLKLRFEASEAGPKAYRMSFIRLGCGDRDELKVAYAQEQLAGALPAARAIKISAGGGDFVFSPDADRTRATAERPPIEVRRASVPVDFFTTAAAGESIELAESSDRQDAESRPRVAKLSTIGLARALGTLVERCAATAAVPVRAFELMSRPSGRRAE